MAENSDPENSYPENSDPENSYPENSYPENSDPITTKQLVSNSINDVHNLLHKNSDTMVDGITDKLHVLVKERMGSTGAKVFEQATPILKPMMKSIITNAITKSNRTTLNQVNNTAIGGKMRKSHKHKSHKHKSHKCKSHKCKSHKHKSHKHKSHKHKSHKHKSHKHKKY